MSANIFHGPSGTVEAWQYDGTAARAQEIADAAGLEIVQQAPRAVALRVPETLSFSPGDYYEADTREIAILTGGWFWVDRAAKIIGCEWDQYFREHFAHAAQPASAR
ncbi:hypothetical protein BKG82_26995 [Mycobacteroides chelonae]|uniref:Uncharacterized protein n=1 Tax=Mycobacteroides chelonae TaxID=1774 RepID=A0A1S1LG89_MYCCH|nr:hypothetical protein [Mycobacteroides chelonae]OHU12712.1 hypothetical protein BKG74_22500 [Mycobacteroides chelonae]OHU47301.1 hypothetical protein BKG82_26995 [Mycobacteroides chelonae]